VTCNFWSKSETSSSWWRTKIPIRNNLTLNHWGWLRSPIIRQREAWILSASESRICTSVKMAEAYRQSPLLTDTKKRLVQCLKLMTLWSRCKPDDPAGAVWTVGGILTQSRKERMAIGTGMTKTHRLSVHLLLQEYRVVVTDELEAGFLVEGLRALKLLVYQNANRARSL